MRNVYAQKVTLQFGYNIQKQQQKTGYANKICLEQHLNTY